MRKIMVCCLILASCTAFPKDMYLPFEEAFPIINPIRPVQIAEIKTKPKLRHKPVKKETTRQKVLKKKVLKKKVVPKKITSKGLKKGIVTTYAKKFEGRRMASGVRFSHSKHYVASRCFRFGTKIRMHYGRRSTVVTVMDRGGLPLHRPDRVQFDLPQKVAKELGLYRVVKGKTDRIINYEILN